MEKIKICCGLPDKYLPKRKSFIRTLSTASGLSQWFADDVVINEDKALTLYNDWRKPLCPAGDHAQHKSPCQI